MLASTAVELSLSGSNFGTTEANVVVYVTCSRCAMMLSAVLKPGTLSDTGMTVLITGLSDATLGPLNGQVAIGRVLSLEAHLGIVEASYPVVTESALAIARNTNGNRIAINGLRFGSIASAISVSLKISDVTLPSTIVSCTKKRVVIDIGDTD